MPSLEGLAMSVIFFVIGIVILLNVPPVTELVTVLGAIFVILGVIGVIISIFSK
jgi:hypothetical protein